MIMRKTPSRRPAPAAVPVPKPTRGPVSVLVGTRKGGFILRSDGARRTWKLLASEPAFDATRDQVLELVRAEVDGGAPA